jgi:hypothetical protein
LTKKGIIFLELIFSVISLWACGAKKVLPNSASFGIQNHRGCEVLASNGVSVKGTKSDPLAKLLNQTDRCPTNVQDFRKLLMASGAKISTSFIGNRGFHNPESGSFSFFEWASGEIPSLGLTLSEGEFFFGHFTSKTAAGKLVLEQIPTQGALMIELIVWDKGEGVFNFYEMIGNGSQGRWFYRGNSIDIIEDVKLLSRQRSPEEKAFGPKLRCSGCHLAGGPIIKERAAPHNDWWTALRPLPLGSASPDAEVTGLLNQLKEASLFSMQVDSGMKKLLQSDKFQKVKSKTSLQEQLRPLFCDEEINIATDSVPLDGPSNQVTIPSGFFVNEWLTQGNIAISKNDYLKSLQDAGSVFPEISRPDADHAWSTPVKGISDMQNVELLIQKGVIDREFAFDVLAVNIAKPMLSKERCELLKMVPLQFKKGWDEEFKRALAGSATPAGKELFENLTAQHKTSDYHVKKAQVFLNKCAQNLQIKGKLQETLNVLFERRAAVFEAEISSNPRGQILEPGFRVVFPLPSKNAIRRNSFLNENCEVEYF